MVPVSDDFPDELRLAYVLGWDMGGEDDLVYPPFTSAVLNYCWGQGCQDRRNPSVRGPRFLAPEVNPTWADDGF